MNKAAIGHVISVAGSEVFGVLEPRAAQHAGVGRVVRLEGSEGRAFGIITTLRRDGLRRASDDKRFIGIRLVGEILKGQNVFQRGVSSHPSLDSPIHAAGPEELSTMFARPEAATVRLGTLNQAPDIQAYALTDNLLGKHFAVLGTTGAGKSCAMTLILRAILDAHPCGHIVMLDPHNEYGRAFADSAELLNPSNFKLPYWLLTLEEMARVLVSRDTPERSYAEIAILRRALIRVKSQQQDEGLHVTVDTPIPFRLSELVRAIREDMGSFNRADAIAPFQHLLDRIETVSNDKRFAFMFSGLMVNDTMGQVLSQLLRIPVAGKPMTILDISGVPSEIVDVTVSVLFRLVFEFALWSEREKAPPILLVCEEAHRYVPNDTDAGFAPTRQSIARIAKEGRKYGLGLCLVTQRPSELALDSLSQCNTIFALRLGNERDLEFVRGAVPDGSRWLIDALPALNTREAIIIGDGVSVPMHIRFDELPPNRRPASTTPRFSARWQQDDSSPDLIEDTIRRWRRQIRAGEDPAAAPSDTGSASPTGERPDKSVAHPTVNGAGRSDSGGATDVPASTQGEGAPGGPEAEFSIRKPHVEAEAPVAPPNGSDVHPPNGGGATAASHDRQHAAAKDAGAPPASTRPVIEETAPVVPDPARAMTGSSLRRRFAGRFG